MAWSQQLSVPHAVAVVEHLAWKQAQEVEPESNVAMFGVPIGIVPQSIPPAPLLVPLDVPELVPLDVPELVPLDVPLDEPLVEPLDPEPPSVLGVPPLSSPLQPMKTIPATAATADSPTSN